MLAVGACTACLRFSPFETDLAENERGKTAENLRQLEERPEPAARYRIGLLADSHDYFDELAEVVDELNRRDDLELVVHLGDLTSFGLREEFRWSLEQLERLNVPYFTVIGNHDAISNGPRVYTRMFGPFDYVVTHGNVRFVLFNSNTLEFGAEVPDLSWLEQNTFPQSGECVIAITHQSPSQVSHYDSVLRKNQVELLVTAHMHAPSVVEMDGLSAVRIGAAKWLDYAIVSVGNGLPEVEFCSGQVCSLVP